MSASTNMYIGIIGYPMVIFYFIKIVTLISLVFWLYIIKWFLQHIINYKILSMEKPQYDNFKTNQI